MQVQSGLHQYWREGSFTGEYSEKLDRSGYPKICADQEGGGWQDFEAYGK